MDFRAGKVFRLGRARTQISLDLYNLLNVDAVQSYNQTFVANGSWLLPTGILAARFAKITGQIDFQRERERRWASAFSAVSTNGGVS